MNTDHRIRRDGERDLKFKGERIAFVSSKYGPAGQRDRWRELSLYRTAKGRYVTSDVFRTCWMGERDTHEARVFDHLEDIVDYLGMDDLTKDLYEAADIDAAETIE